MYDRPYDHRLSQEIPSEHPHNSPVAQKRQNKPHQDTSERPGTLDAGRRRKAIQRPGNQADAAKPARLSCGAALDLYWSEHVRPKVVDKRRAEDAIVNLKLFFGALAVADVDIPVSRKYAEGRAGGSICVRTKHGLVRKASAGTIKRELAVLMAAIRHCVAWRKAGISAADIPTVEKPKTKRSKGLWLFLDELERLRVSADQQTCDAIDFCYYTGARKGSIERLTWDQIDIQRGRINLGKHTDPETKKRRPIVPIGPELKAILLRLETQRTTDAVFCDRRGFGSGFKSALRKASLSKLVAKDMRPAGSLSLHVLRHSRATHLLQRGVPVKAVADLLGDEITTVLRVYGHACPDYLEDALG